MPTSRLGRWTHVSTAALAVLCGGLLASGCGVEVDSPEPGRALEQALGEDAPRSCGTRTMTSVEVTTVDEEFGLGIIEPISPPTEPGLSPGATPIPRFGVTPAELVRQRFEEVQFDVIPVAVHVIHQSDGTGDVTDTQIDEQIRVLNESWSGITADDGTATSFRFHLVSIDRTENDAWFAMAKGSDEEQDAKEALRVGGDNTLNLYTAGLMDDPDENLIGWATFPWDLDDDPDRDGVVIHYRTLPGGGATGFDEGDTATHEVGHWLGLLHTFESEGSCASPGDSVNDTFPQRDPVTGCPANPTSCGGTPDNVDNFMNYVDDGCMVRFTPGQARRMRASYNSIRAPIPDLGITIVD